MNAGSVSLQRLGAIISHLSLQLTMLQCRENAATTFTWYLGLFLLDATLLAVEKPITDKAAALHLGMDKTRDIEGPMSHVQTASVSPAPGTRTSNSGFDLGNF